MIENIMDQRGQAKSSEIAPSPHFTEAMKRYVRRVFGIYNPVTGQRDQYYRISNFLNVSRSCSSFNPSQNRKNKRQVIKIGRTFFVHSYPRTLPILNHNYSNQEAYLKFSFIENNDKFRLHSADFFVPFPKKSVPINEISVSEERKKWRELGIIQNNNILNPGFARYVITHPDSFGFRSVGQIIDEYIQEKSPLYKAFEQKYEDYLGDFVDSVFEEISCLDYGTFIMTLNSDEMEFNINQGWREIKYEDIVNIFEEYGEVEDIPYLPYKGSLDIPYPKNFKQFIINFIFILIIVKSKDIEDVDPIKIINQSIPGRKETAQILEYFLSLKDGSHIDKSKKKTDAFRTAARIVSDQISVEFPPKNEKMFESTESVLLSRISSHLNSLKIGFI